MLQNCKYQRSNKKVVVECLKNESNSRAQRFFNGDGTYIAGCQGALVGRVVDVKVL
jgi:hypothetical protein